MATASPSPFISVTAYGEADTRLINANRVASVTKWGGPVGGPVVNGATIQIDYAAPQFIQITEHGATASQLVNADRIANVVKWTNQDGATVDGATIYIDDGNGNGRRINTDTSLAAIRSLLVPTSSINTNLTVAAVLALLNP
ncbi:MAG TPA: hypothetical protein VF503_09115 [Sphingobium sp.]|uniref:hypothetical protein n=1 Tax=Sphingobium sp. TaxID=1912891 RepID=UPI002ECFB903